MTHTNLDIEQLLALCKTGHRKAQLEVYNRFYRAMYNTAFRIVGNSFDAEDIMQESFLTAFTKIDSLKEPATFSAWLKRIVINKSLQHYKMKKSKAEIPIDEKLFKMKVENDVDDNIDVDNLKKDVNSVLSALRKLKSNYRIGLTLHLIEGYDYDEVGKIMGISYGNCRTLISRAKESLRKNLIPVTKN